MPLEFLESKQSKHSANASYPKLATDHIEERGALRFRVACNSIIPHNALMHNANNRTLRELVVPWMALKSNGSSANW